ncbi:hypothetical protein IMZ48_07155 [Candidatus Bathyarchaeota archaeon]|nr:hypothetical protein [Candidatus Bathyarchaeota archaeon]
MRLPTTLLAYLAAALLAPATAQTFTDCNPLESKRISPICQSPDASH